MTKIDLIIDALTVANSSVWSARIDEALFVARELKAELTNRKWVGLTDDEQYEIVIGCGAMSADWQDFVVAIEQKLREKNGGNR
jgi:hypothetical protein